MEDARHCFLKGEYEDAIVFYDGLLAMYETGGPLVDHLKEERAKAGQCQSLVLQASTLIDGHSYTKAIENYETVLKLNPSDPTAREKIEECKLLLSEYLASKEEDDALKECKTLSDYQAFVNKYPTSKYIPEVDKIISRLEKEDDEQQWLAACRNNTILAYEDYLSNTKQSEHRIEAQVRLAPLYSVRADEMFRNGNYEQAELDYTKVIKQGTMTADSWPRYRKAREENLFARISQPTTREYAEMLTFINDYPDSKYIRAARGYLVEYDLDHGYFDDAREQVSNYEILMDGSTAVDKQAWLRIIKEREKEYNRRRKNTRD